MGITIFKSVLTNDFEQFVPMRVGAEILSCGEQHGKVCLWWRCDDQEPEASRLISVAFTGMQAPPFGTTWRFIGTAPLFAGNLICHVFECMAPAEPAHYRP